MLDSENYSLKLSKIPSFLWGEAEMILTKKKKKDIPLLVLPTSLRNLTESVLEF